MYTVYTVYRYYWINNKINTFKRVQTFSTDVINSIVKFHSLKLKIIIKMSYLPIITKYYTNILVCNVDLL